MLVKETDVYKGAGQGGWDKDGYTMYTRVTDSVNFALLLLTEMLSETGNREALIYNFLIVGLSLLNLMCIFHLEMPQLG